MRRPRLTIGLAAVLLLLPTGATAQLLTPDAPDPSPEEIGRMLGVLDATGEALSTCDSECERTIERSRLVDRRRVIFRTLGASTAGVGSMVRYCLEHRQESALEPELRDVAWAALTNLSRARRMGREEVTRGEIRDLLLLVPSFRCGLTLSPEQLRFDDAMALSDVWNAWLDAVEPEVLGRETSCPRNRNLFDSACQELARTMDPSGVDRVATILARAAPGGSHWGLRYLNSMGDPRAFDLLIEEQGGWDCGSLGSWLEVPPTATTEQLEKLLRCRSFPLDQVNGFRKRPDLARAVVTILLQLHDNSLAKLGEPGPDGTVPRERGWLLEAGEGAISDDALVGALRSATSQNRWKDATLWLRLLEQRAGMAGTLELLRLAAGPHGSNDHGQLQHSASRVILRRVLDETTSAAMLARLEALPPEDRAQVAEGMAAQLGSWWASPPQDLLGGMHCVWFWKAYWPRWTASPGSREAGWKGFIHRHQDRLLGWLPWVPDRDRQVAVYGFMACSEARQRFLDLLAGGNSMAAQLTWRLRLDVPRRALRSALDNTAVDLAQQRAFLLLRLAELGGDAAYRRLTELMLPSFADFSSPLWGFQEGFLEEAVRRDDVATIVEGLSRAKTLDDTSHERIGRAEGSLLTPSAWVTAYLLRDAPATAGHYLEPLDPKDSDQRGLLLEIIAAANTPAAEPILRKVQPHLEIPPGATYRECGPSADCRRWAAALCATDTPWCRDRLADLEAWRCLAEFGDPRGAVEGRYSLDLGQLDTGIERATRRCRAAELRILPMPFSSWTNERNWPLTQASGVARSIRQLVTRWDGLTVFERAAAMTLVQAYPQSVSDALLTKLLHDPYGGLRLLGLDYLYRFPRESMREELARVERHDPKPWCRRMAHEILIRPENPIAIRAHLPFERAEIGGSYKRAPPPPSPAR